MIRLPIVIAIFVLPHLARADVDEQQDPNDLQQDQANDAQDHVAGLPNCNEAGVLPCLEMVWVGRVQRKMAFFDVNVQTNPPTHNFYVVAPQTATLQGTAPFLHDHVVGDDDGVYWHGFFALCSAQGFSSGACVTSAAEGDPPLARTWPRTRGLATSGQLPRSSLRAAGSASAQAQLAGPAGIRPAARSSAKPAERRCGVSSAICVFFGSSGYQLWNVRVDDDQNPSPLRQTCDVNHGDLRGQICCTRARNWAHECQFLDRTCPPTTPGDAITGGTRRAPRHNGRTAPVSWSLRRPQRAAARSSLDTAPG